MSVSQTCPNCRVNFFGPTHNVNENLCDDCVESELLQHPAVAAALAAAEQRGRGDALYVICAHIANCQRAPYQVGWDVISQALREVADDIENDTLFGHGAHQPPTEEQS